MSASALFYCLMTLIILILATWRITSLLSRERGPFDILGRLREFVGVGVDDLGQPYGENELARLVMCPWCLSLWVSVVLVGIDRLYTYLACPACVSLYDSILLALTVSAGAVIVNEVVEWLEQAPPRS